jgi:hypothetical protein
MDGARRGIFWGWIKKRRGGRGGSFIKLALAMRALVLVRVTLFGHEPDLAYAEDADMKAIAAVTAADGESQNQQIGQIGAAKMRGPQIPRSAPRAMNGHRAFSSSRSSLGEPWWTMLNHNAYLRPEERGELFPWRQRISKKGRERLLCPGANSLWQKSKLPKNIPQGLKPVVSKHVFSARLKSCPFTKPLMK